MALPMLTEESVAPTRPLATPYRDMSASPAAFGETAGQALESTGAQLGEIAYKRRVFTAQQEAYSAEDQFGRFRDVQLENYKKEARGLQSTPDVNYPAMIAQLQTKYGETLDKEHARTVGELKDPLAQKMFDVRMRLQNQAFHRQILTWGDQAVQEWDKNSTNSQIEQDVRRAGNVTGNVEQDAAFLGMQAGLSAKKLADYHQRAGIPNEKTEIMKQKLEAGMVDQALKAYGPNYAAGLALLKAQAGTDESGQPITIGQDPDHPERQSILDGAETGAWIKHFMGHKTESQGANLGEMLFQESRTKGFDLEKKLSALYQSGQYTPEAIGKARAQFTSAVEHGHALEEVHRDNVYHAAGDYVIKNFKGDIDLALRSGDKTFATMWGAIGTDQGKLRTSLDRADKNDPEADAEYNKVLDLSAVPGKLSQTYPTAEALDRAVHGPARQHWPAILKLWEQDSKRDTSSDVHYQLYKTEAETRARVVTGWTSGKGQAGHGAWDEASPEQRNARVYILDAAEKAWAAHEQARKQTPGKVSDTTWWTETLGDIMHHAQELQKSGSFKMARPPKPGESPASATTIRTRKPQRVIDGVAHEWDGTKWNPTKSEE